MRCYALGGLCVAVVALAAWGAAPGGSYGGTAGGDESQSAGWSLPIQRLLDRERQVLEATSTPEAARQLDERIIEEQASADEPVGGLPNQGVVAPITFYACHGPKGGFCVGTAGPLPLAEGQAACGGAWPMGAVVLIEGDPLGPVVCNDRGWLAPHQVDRFFWHEEDGWAWLRQIGSYARVQHEP